MSLLDELAEGQIDYDHLCIIDTYFGPKPRNHERLLFAYDFQMGMTHKCICGREFKVVEYGYHPVWKEISK